MWKYVHLVSRADIRTHDLLNFSILRNQLPRAMPVLLFALIFLYNFISWEDKKALLCNLPNALNPF